MGKSALAVKEGKVLPTKKAEAGQVQRDLEAALRECSRLNAENNDLSIKLRQQIARGNALRDRLAKAGLTTSREPAGGAPESPTAEAAARAYLRAHPNQKTCTRKEVTDWLTSSRAEHPAG